MGATEKKWGECVLDSQGACATSRLGNPAKKTRKKENKKPRDRNMRSKRDDKIARRNPPQLLRNIYIRCTERKSYR